MLSTAIILPGEAEMFPINSLRNIAGVEWDGIFYSGKREHPIFDRALIYSSPEIIPLLCDLLIVVDPAFCSLEYLSFAIRNGCHLFLSDKLNLSKDERKQLIHLANEGGTFIRIQNDFLFHPFNEKIRVASNYASFIEVSHTVKSKKEKLNELINDNLLMIFQAAGSQIHKYDLFCGTLPSGEPDIINIHLNFKNGSVASLKLQFIEHDEEGHYLSIHSGGEITLFDFTKNSIKYWPGNHLNNLEEEVSTNPLLEQIGEFVRNITENSNPGFSLTDEMMVFLLMEKIKKKIENQISYKTLAS